MWHIGPWTYRKLATSAGKSLGLGQPTDCAGLPGSILFPHALSPIFTEHGLNVHTVT